MKKLINRPQDVPAEFLAGLALAHAGILRVCLDPVYVVRVDAPVPGKTAIVSGGGSGHEPMHVGFVGQGMLDAACPGQVFTSPTPDQIEAATLAVNGGAGVLHIVKNYTGDIMNFEMAAELCQARGMEVRAVVINDDVAVEDSLYTAGRRGVGVTVFAEKLCGAAAQRGYDLARVEALCRKVNANGRSMGMALTSCTVPAAGKPTFELGEDEMEMGIGIHGEPGRERMPLLPAAELTARMAGTCPGGPAVPHRRRSHRHGQRHGRYPVDGTLSRLRGIGADLARAGNPRRAPPGGELHHQPRNGRLLHHAAQSR